MGVANTSHAYVRTVSVEAACAKGTGSGAHVEILAWLGAGQRIYHTTTIELGVTRHIDGDSTEG